MMADKKIEFNSNRVDVTPDEEPLFSQRNKFQDSLFSVEASFFWDGLSMQTMPKGTFEPWLQCAKEDFLSIYEGIYGLCFRSINPKALAEMEIRELNNFFECGESLSMAVNSEAHIFRNSEPLFKVELSSEVIFNHYLILLRGNFDTIFTKGYLDILSSGEVNLEPEKLDDKRNIKWWATARVQALMWAKDYLEDLIKEGKGQEVFSPLTPSGFQVSNAKIVPVLYKALIDNNLIAPIELDDFEKALVKGQGVIQWLTKNTKEKVVGANELIHLIDELIRKKLISSDSRHVTTARIFIDKHEIPFNKDTLTQAKKPANAELLNGIVDKLAGIAMP